jgi:UDP-N-acetylglucosamine:LPS N-acetylglucosamine transferase
VAFGGSLGARRINQAVVGLADQWRDRTDVAIFHIVGRRDWDELSSGRPDGPGLSYRQVPYEDRMPLVYAAADVAVCRAGASTVAELTAVGLPAILVPLPGAPGDHQTANGRALSSAGAALLVPDAELTPLRLASELDALLGDETGLDAMAAAARRLARPGAAKAVAQLAADEAVYGRRRWRRPRADRSGAASRSPAAVREGGIAPDDAGRADTGRGAVREGSDGADTGGSAGE